jgi:hypothetical protein
MPKFEKGFEVPSLLRFVLPGPSACKIFDQKTGNIVPVFWQYNAGFV